MRRRSCCCVLLAAVAIGEALQLRGGDCMPRAAVQRAPSPRLTSDDDLMASLRSRLQTDDKSVLRPLGPDEVGADQMGPADVIDYVMRSIAQDPEAGLRVLLGFAVSDQDSSGCIDSLGQLQPGSFGSPAELREFLAADATGVGYETLTALEEWKAMGPPDMSNLSRSAAQKLLVRRDGARCPSSLSRPHPPSLSVSRSPHRTFGARSQLARPIRQPRPRAGRGGRGDGAAVASDDHLHVGQLRGAVASTQHAIVVAMRPARSARRVRSEEVFREGVFAKFFSR